MVLYYLIVYVLVILVFVWWLYISCLNFELGLIFFLLEVVRFFVYLLVNWFSFWLFDIFEVWWRFWKMLISFFIFFLSCFENKFKFLLFCLWEYIYSLLICYWFVKSKNCIIIDKRINKVKFRELFFMNFNFL